ncbi:DUF6894 family protein [Methylobacterium planeticum]|uniref:DUF6894 domain-containing protein n=1 Tax=Methylobacterium planeticum TaxID=2615211 RepID=A0A6N6MY82_9HYPH|nr:hypothetical protein [Methylobacterium planeticum]KAB1075993.1 hypothetical protein F6X51_00140 [Methylobacterium planeticum]
MNQHIFFDLTDGLTTLSDETGIAVRNLDEAIAQAILAVSELRSSGELTGSGDWRMVLRDTHRSVLTMLPIG